MKRGISEFNFRAGVAFTFVQNGLNSRVDWDGNQSKRRKNLNSKLKKTTSNYSEIFPKKT